MSSGKMIAGDVVLIAVLMAFVLGGLLGLALGVIRWGQRFYRCAIAYCEGLPDPRCQARNCVMHHKVWCRDRCERQPQLFKRRQNGHP